MSSRIPIIRKRFKNRKSYWKIKARKSKCLLKTRHIDKLESIILSKYKLSLNELFEYRYGEAIADLIMFSIQENPLLKMIKTDNKFQGAQIPVPKFSS